MKPNLFRLLLAFLFLMMLGVAVFMGHSHLANETEKAAASNRSTANLLARIFMERKKAVLGVLQSYANRPSLISAAKEKSPSKASRDLSNLVENHPIIDRVFITDAQGTLWVNFPVDEQSHGKNFRYRDWYGGVSREWRPYVSGVYKRLIGAQDLAVAYCLPIRDEKDTVIGILGASQSIGLFAQLIQEVDPDPPPPITLLDQRGNIIYSNRIPLQGKVIPFAETPFLAEAMQGKKGETQYRDSSDGNRLKYAAFAPVPDLGWTVIVEKTQGEIWASAADHIIYHGLILLLLFLLIAFALGYLRRGFMTARLLELRRTDETLRQSALEVKRLSEENAILAEIGRLVTSSLDMKEIYAQLAMRVRELIHFDWLTINLLNSDGNTGTLVYGAGHGVEERREGLVFPLPGTLTGHLAHSSSGLIVDADTPEDLQDRFPFLLPNFKAGLRSFMAVPLLHRDITIGSMIFQAMASRAYNESHLRLAQRIADQIAGAIAIAQLFAERQRTEAALRKSELFLQNILKHLPVGVWIADPDGKIISGNLAGQEIWGGARFVGVEHYGEYKGWWADTGNPIGPEEWALARAVKKGETSLKEEIVIRSFDGNYKMILSSALPICNDNQEIIGAVMVQQDISEHKKAEDALKRSELKFRELFEYAPVGYYEYDTEGKISNINQTMLQMMQYSREEMVGKPVWKFIVEEEVSHRMALDKLSGKIPPGRDFIRTFRRKDGRTFLGLIQDLLLYDTQKKIVGIRSAIQDVTEGKKAEEQIRASLQEKEILLKEIHHRVKNNLQVISSLLNLQSKHIKDPQDLEMFRESQNRVKSLGLIHERLYQSKNLARIDFAEYLDNLVNHLLSTYRINPTETRIRIEADRALLSVDVALPCGLIVNELVSNSLKHAFPPGKEGDVMVRLKLLEESKYLLQVSDNGVGFPANLDFRTTESLGLQLVNTLVHQLNGEINLRREEGTEFTIQFSAG